MRRLFVVTCLALASACSSDSTTAATSADLAGTWNLQTVNGNALPFTVSQVGTTKVEVTAEVVTLTSSTYTVATSVRTTTNGQVTTRSDPDNGTYTLSGSVLSFRSTLDGSTGTANYSGTTLTVVDEGNTKVYKKSS